jgi:predicted acyltransferase
MNESAATPQRLLYLDAFRGFTMVCMIGSGFGLLHLRRDPVLGALARQFEHAAWEGLTAWDLVMPFFLCVVGAVMPVSFARRRAAGESWWKSFGHVLRRSGLLVAWGIFERSVQTGKPLFDILSVLTHIAVAYLIAFLLLRASWKVQAGAALGILIAHWVLYQFAQGSGITGPFIRDANVGSFVDRMLFGKTWSGSYTCLNMIGETVNVLAGVLVGRMMASAMPRARKMLLLAASGASCIALGLALWQWIPMIKRLWTASYTICSIGCTLLALLLFYWLCEVLEWRAWTRVFVVVGSNSIFLYLFHECNARYFNSIARTFLDWTVPLCGAGGLVLQAWAVLLFEIHVCFWLYRRKIFFKV